MIGLIIALVVIAIIVVSCAFAWYRITPPTEAHMVVTPRNKMIVSSDDKVSTNGKKTYFAIPKTIPFFGRQIRIMDLTIKEIVLEQESYEKNQARFKVKSSTKYRINEVKRAAETFDNNTILGKQLEEVIISSTNAIASQYDIVEMRSKKQEMSLAIHKEIEDDLKQWGLELVNFQLIDFQDTNDSKIISNISRRREVEIESKTRQENADKLKQARVKEAESEEEAKTREIKKDQVIAEREQNKKQKISEQEKIAKGKEYEVKEVEITRQAEIDKKKVLIDAKAKNEAEAVNKQTKKLEGEGDRLKAEESAKAAAAPIREKGLAEAEAKEKLQKALNQFGPEAIRALVAEKVVEANKVVGIETAKALEKADLKVFSGDGDKQGFNLGKLISSVSVADEGTANALLNRIARPNDLGIGEMELGVSTKPTPKPEQKPNKVNKPVKK